MNQYLMSLRLEPALCRKLLPIPLCRPARRCFPKATSRYLNHLVLIPLRARDPHGRFAKGSSGQSAGPTARIRNPRPRVPDLVARPLSAQALSDLLDRKPHLLRPLIAQIFPLPLDAIDPAKRLRIDLARLRTAEDVRQVEAKLLGGRSARDPNV